MGKYKIGIIGAGPVGSIMAAYLSRNNENVYIVDTKKDLIQAIRDKGIALTGAGDHFTAAVKGTGYYAASLSKFGVDLIFVAVKFNFLDTLLDELKLIFKPGQKIVLLQNGIDNEDRAAEKFSQEDILRFVVNYAGMVLKPGLVRFSFFNPPNYIGVLSSKNKPIAAEIADFISDAGLETEFTPEIKKHEWKKTILNAALMPVCATTGLTMKQAMQMAETRFLCEQILSECIGVAQKLGFEYESNFFENCLAYLDNAGDHKPSTSIDLEAGNPIEYIFQPIIDYGKKIGYPTPYLESLTKVVRALEHKKRKKKI
ncbi:MAG: ketopantoate reductase family protein [Candidatus Aminicenantales bacterium]